MAGLNDKKNIIVLGGAGAIGSRLVHALVSSGHRVTVVVRSLASAVRIGRLDIAIIQLDLSSVDSLQLTRLFEDQNVVIDCSYSSGSNRDMVVEESQEIAKLIMQSADAAKVEHVIHFGTISVYPSDGGVIDESISCEYSGDIYGDGKLAAERIFLQDNLYSAAVTVLQLPIVFGPFMNWTISVVNEFNNGDLVMPDSTLGHCSPLFVDDVVDATESALTRSLQSNEKILLSDEAMPWSDYYRAHAKLLSGKSLKLIDRKSFFERLDSKDRTEQPYNRLKRQFSDDGDFRQLVLSQFGIRTLYRLFKKHRGQAEIDKLKSSIAGPVSANVQESLLSKNRLALFDSLPKVESNKAKLILDFTPTKFDVAIKETGAWLEWAGMVDSN